MIEIKGNGNIVSREINVSTFIRLHLACLGNIELYIGEEEKVIIETDENLQDFFSANNAGRTLYVAMNAKFKKPLFTSATVKVFIRQLDVLYLGNVGNLDWPGEIVLARPLEIKVYSNGSTALNVSAPSIKITNQSNGNLVLKGNCEKMEIKHAANGHFDSSQMNVADLSIKHTANGNAIVRAEKTIRITHKGNGYIHYYGNAAVEDVQQYGNGELKHMKGEPSVA